MAERAHAQVTEVDAPHSVAVSHPDVVARVIDGADFTVDDGYHVIQVTPPGSERSLIFGTGVTAAASGSLDGLHLILTDIERAVAELTERGVAVAGPFRDTAGVFHHAETTGRVRACSRDAAATVPSPSSTIRTATAVSCKQSCSARPAADPGVLKACHPTRTSSPTMSSSSD
ncbi:VOC family protein [Nocardia otitidiscaviarum]|uniref:hypothetical protein n=1 Tax=Nocardia otitidiscaviarum TaxID=1823 RepID=UPI001E5810FE|nr:hypothetical protein [Nocardia otitidiscaviarum]